MVKIGNKITTIFNHSVVAPSIPQLAMSNKDVTGAKSEMKMPASEMRVRLPEESDDELPEEKYKEMDFLLDFKIMLQ